MKNLLIVVGCVVALAACTSQNGLSFGALPAGDATRGQKLYSESIGGTPPCANCHSLTDNNLGLEGPSLKGIGAGASTRVAGQSAGDYLLQSITQPAAFIMPGYGNLMYAQYASAIDNQAMADLIAFLLAQ